MLSQNSQTTTSISQVPGKPDIEIASLVGIYLRFSSSLSRPPMYPKPSRLTGRTLLAQQPSSVYIACHNTSNTQFLPSQRTAQRQEPRQPRRPFPSLYTPPPLLPHDPLPPPPLSPISPRPPPGLSPPIPPHPPSLPKPHQSSPSSSPRNRPYTHPRSASQARPPPPRPFARTVAYRSRRRSARRRRGL